MNDQPIESAGHITLELDVVDIWDTIQGEGPYVGMPAVFVRLAGCNLQCPLCDTNYTKGRRWFPVMYLAQRIATQWAHREVVVITGGEPFRQALALQRLCHELVIRDKAVQIETNGVIATEMLEKIDWTALDYQDVVQPNPLIVCSPKTPKVTIPSQVVFAWKYVLRAGEVDPVDGLPTSVLGGRGSPHRPPPHWSRQQVYVQPADEKDPELNQRNLEVALASCQKFGYRFSLQVHKLIGVA